MIRGHFHLEQGHPHPYVEVLVRVEGGRQTLQPVRFLIDTGAAVTCIHPSDAINRLGLPPALLANPRAWPRSEIIGGIGGSARMFIVDAQLQFDEPGAYHQYELPIRVAQPTLQNHMLPSILGWDVLSGFQLFVDRLNGVVTLEPHRL